VNRRHALAGLCAAPALLLRPRAPAAARDDAAARFDRPVRLVVPFAPGGTSDILARILAPELSAEFGQSVVVENRPGAAGNLGADNVAKSRPDGHSLLVIDAGILATAPSLFPRLPFDAVRDLAPVSMLIYAPYILAVHPSVPARTAAEFAGYARANPDKVNNANSGVGAANHLTAVVLAKHWGAELTQVPYRGGSAALAAVGNGEAQMIINGATATQPFVQSGQLRGLAVSGPRRLAAFPELPTFAELGWPAAESGTYQALFAAAGTPPAMLRRLDEGFRSVLSRPAVAARMADLGGEPRTEGPQALGAWLGREIEGWGRVIRDNEIRVE